MSSSSAVSVDTSNSRLPKLSLEKSLRRYHPLHLAKALKNYRVQEKHLIRCELMGHFELMRCNQFNMRTHLPLYKEIDIGMFEAKVEHWLFKRYRELHPKRRHARWRCNWGIGEEALQLWSDLEKAEIPFMERLYDSADLRLSFLAGEIPLPSSITDMQKKCWTYINHFPDSDSDASDSSEPECELDEDNLCDLCYPNYNTSNTAETGVIETVTEPSCNSEPLAIVASGQEEPLISPSPSMKPDQDANESVSEPSCKRQKLMPRKCERPKSTFKLCQHEKTWGRRKTHTEEFNQFLKDCAMVDQESDDCCSGKKLWEAYRTWGAAKDRSWLIPEKLFYKCAQIKLCMKKPKGKIEFHGIALY